jgi:hypothetical protein
VTAAGEPRAVNVELRQAPGGAWAVVARRRSGREIVLATVGGPGDPRSRGEVRAAAAEVAQALYERWRLMEVRRFGGMGKVACMSISWRGDGDPAGYRRVEVAEGRERKLFASGDPVADCAAADAWARWRFEAVMASSSLHDFPDAVPGFQFDGADMLVANPAEAPSKIVRVRDAAPRSGYRGLRLEGAGFETQTVSSQRLDLEEDWRTAFAIAKRHGRRLWAAPSVRERLDEAGLEPEGDGSLPPREPAGLRRGR